MGRQGICKNYTSGSNNTTQEKSDPVRQSTIALDDSHYMAVILSRASSEGEIQVLLALEDLALKQLHFQYVDEIQ